MKIYITTLEKDSLRNYFLNFRSYTVIDVREIVDEETRSGYYTNQYVKFLIERRICAEIKRAKKRRNQYDIIYCGENITDEIVNNIKDEFSDCEVDSVVYIENDDLDKINTELFDSIMNSPIKRRRKT